MNVAVFSTKPYDCEFLSAANAGAGHDLRYLDVRLSAETAALAHGAKAVCAFVNDELNRAALELLAGGGVRLVALRSAGFNHVDLEAAHGQSLRSCDLPASKRSA